MGTVIDDQAARERADREERRLAKLRERQRADDVRAVFALPEARRVLAAFLRDGGADVSPLRADPQLTAHAIGWQDAASWWLNALRTHCPEREVQLRAEAKREAAPIASQDDPE